MTKTTTFDRAEVAAEPVRPLRRRRRLGVVAGPLLIVALAGFAVWRFANPDAPSATAPAGPPTLGEQVATLERATVERPNDANAWRQLGIGLAQLAHQTADPTLYQRVNTAFDRADELEPQSPATLVARASVQAVLHQFVEARRLATQALDVRPSYPDALVVLVDAEIELGRYDDAATHLQQLLDHKPSMPAFARASYLRELHGDLDGAILALRQADIAGAQAPVADRALTLRIRGDVLLNHGRLDDAAMVYDEILRLVPGYPDARIGNAKVAAARGDTAGGIAQLRALLDEVNDPHAWIALADIAALTDPNLEQTSIDTARELILVEAANGSAVDVDLAAFDADHERVPADETVARARRGYQARPSVHGADTLAWALYRAGRPAEAAPFIAEATRLGTIDASIRYHAAAINEANGNLAQAKSDLTEAFRNNPWFTTTQRANATALASRLGVQPPSAWTAR
jgi:tetratricopeptide (TPR) repeat protein